MNIINIYLYTWHRKIILHYTEEDRKDVGVN